MNETSTLKKSGAFDPSNLFSGGGEMITLMRRQDWAATQLGPVETWSPVLRTMVRFLLANRFPLLLWWGPDFCQLYNDAYRPILGTKHPQSLGQPIRECWSEIWHILEPLVRTPFEGGPATWMEDIPLEINRYGFMEETHFTIAYSPVPDETAPRGIGGVLATVHEISEKVVGERRTMALRDLGAGVLEERNAQEACARAAEILANYPKDLPFSLLYLLDVDQRTAHLAGSSGVKSEAAIRWASIIIDPAKPDVWPFHRVIETGQIELVDDLKFLGAVPNGPWSEPPNRAAVVPIHSNTAHQLAGFLVVGLSPRLRYDDSYRGFLDLVSSQIAMVVANARAYEEERKRTEALAEIDRAKTAFFTNISHEFRTPLTLLLTPIEEILGRSNTSLGEQERSDLQVAHRNGMRLLKLVNTLLDFARIEAGRIQASYEPVDLCSLTSDVASMFRSVTEKAGLYLAVECAPLEEPIYVDRDMWEKIVLNLISNAFKFTFNGGIRVGLHDAGDSVELAITDTGTGISQSELPRLFERFHRVEGAAGRTFEGSGIGLALVQELVKLHGGKVTAESMLGRGSTFKVVIPKGKAHLPTDRIQSASNNGSALRAVNSYVAEASKWISHTPEKSIEFQLEDMIAGLNPALGSSADTAGDRATILLADDNTDMREYLQKLLEERYHAIAVSNGAEALQVIEKKRPDLILTDVMMPVMDGFGLLRAVRDNPTTRSLPVILLSARAGEEARMEGGEAGADDYLIKPFSARELLARVGTHLRLTRIRQETGALLLHNERKFRAFVSASSDVVYRMSPDWTEMWQVDGRGFISDTAGPKRNWIDEYIAPEDQPAVLKGIQHAIQTRSVFELEHRVRQVDGTLGWTLSRAIPILDEKGEIVEWLGAAKNVTSRKKTEEALLRGEAELRQLNAHLNIELAASVRMQQLSARLVHLEDFDQLLSEILYAAIDISHADMGNVQLLDNNGLKVVVQQGFKEEFLNYFDSVHQGHAACGTALREAKRVVVEDVTKSPIFIGSPALAIMLTAGARAVQSTPLISQSGEVLGMFSTHYRAPRQPVESELRTLDVLARLAAELIKRRQTEDALRRSEQRLRLAQQAAGIGTFEWDIRTEVNRWTPELEAIYGLAPGTFQGTQEGWEQLLHPDDRPAVLKEVEIAFETGAPVQSEWRAIWPDGGIHWILGRWQVFKDESGTPVRMAGINIDVTDRKMAEEAQRRLAAIVESSDDAIISKDLNGIVTSWNRQAERLFGYTEKEMVGRSILTIIPPELHRDEDMILGKIRSGKKIDHFETIRITKSRARVEVSLSISPVRDEHGNIVGAAKIARDIREGKKIERALRTTEKLAAAGRLAATVAHEINNPLEAVNNLVFLAKRDAGNESKVTEYLCLAECELGRVAHISRQTLGFYRDSTAATRFGVVKTIEDLLSLYEKRFETRKIRVVKQYKIEPEIAAYAGEIRQAFSNLISNAIDAMPTGGALVIRVSEARHCSNSLQSGVRVTILDTGTGIEEHARKSLFEPFFTTKADVGTGLGLWITKNIIEKHHGNIRLITRTKSPDHGTAFSIFLPFGSQDNVSPTASVRAAPGSRIN